MLTDPVVPDPGASYGRAGAASPLAAEDLAIVEEQLGRPSRARSAVVHRCGYGLPTVVRVAPRLEDGTPFPTTFWLTCPALNAAIGTLEAQQQIAAANEALGEHPVLATAYAAAQERLIAFRDQLGGGDKLPGDPTAGGAPGHVKCLHTHVAHHLATGDNVVGERALDQARPVRCPGPCAGPERVDGARGLRAADNDPDQT